MKKTFLFIGTIMLVMTACQSNTLETKVPEIAESNLSTQEPIQPTQTEFPFKSSVAVIGEPEAVYVWDTDRCDDRMVPDLPTRAIRSSTGMIQLTIPSETNFRLVGPDFVSLEPDCDPLFFSDKDRDPANFNNSEWLGATYTEDGNTIYAIVHNEFHGDQAGSVWQSNLDFGGEKDLSIWSYQSWDGSIYYPMKYDESEQVWRGFESLCSIQAQGTHPSINCSPTRTWTSPVEGKVTVSGYVKDSHQGGGNGILAQILKDDQELWSIIIENGDSEEKLYKIEVDVNIGTQIHFRVDAKGDSGWDYTEFISGIDPGPAPCPSNRHDMCTSISLTLGISTDGGQTYSQLPAPNHLIATFPYAYDPEWMRAVWQPSGIVKNPNDGYYYAIIQLDEHNFDYSSNLQAMCAIRTQNLADPASWRAWDGSGFNMKFINPYLHKNVNPEDHRCQPIFAGDATLTYGMTYNSYLEKFVVVGVYGRDDVQGFFYATSDDFVNWSQKELILETPMGFLNGNQTPFDAYPTLIDHDSPSPSFDVTGQRAYLYYSVVTNLSPLNMNLMRVEVEFSK